MSKTCFVSRLGGAGDKAVCSPERLAILRKYAIALRKPNNCLCVKCGKSFHKKPFAISRGEGKYCSLFCRDEDFKKRYSGRGNPQFRTHWQKGSGNPKKKGGAPLCSN